MIEEAGELGGGKALVQSSLLVESYALGLGRETMLVGGRALGEREVLEPARGDPLGVAVGVLAVLGEPWELAKIAQGGQ